MATYVLIYGAGDSAFYWHLVAPELGERGNEVVAVDIPVAQSFAGFTAPLVCAQRPDVPSALAAEALAQGRGQAEAPGRKPWPLDSWPEVPTRYLLCRDDRMFPAEWLRAVVRERLGIVPDEIDGGHCPALSRPRELVDRLEAYRAELEIR